MQRKSTNRRKSRGQGMVEFALVVPILLMVIFAIVDFGWLVFNFAQLYNGVREGVRYGSVSGFSTTAQYLDCDGIRNKIIQMAGFSGITASNITITYDDGRAFDVTAPSTSSYAHSQVGTCPAGLSYTPTSTSSTNNYIPEGSSTAVSRNPQNGDRIVVSITGFNLKLLTPFFKMMLPNGVSITNTTARSIFPGQLAA